MRGFGGAWKRQGGRSSSNPLVAPPADIARRGMITFCTAFDAPPQEFLDEDGHPAGADVDIGIAVADLMGVDVEWRSSDFGDVIAALQAGRCDAINSSLSYTKKRDESMDFALYGLFTDVILVKAGNPQNIHSVDDLSGKEVGRVTGYATDGLGEIEQKLAEAGLESFKQVAFPNEPDALGALCAGEVDTVTLANAQGEHYAKEQPGVFRMVPGIEVFRRQFGFAVREGEKGLQTALSRAIDILYEDGAMCDILRKWNLTSTAGPDRPCEPDQHRGSEGLM